MTQTVKEISIEPPTETIDTAPHRKKSLLSVSQPEKWGKWEGKIDIETGELAGEAFYIVAELIILADQIGGTGRTTENGIEFTVSGYKNGDLVFLQIFFEDPEIGRVPLGCSGKLAAGETQISGTWHADCLLPESCGCDGHDGHFEFFRIGDNGSF